MHSTAKVNAKPQASRQKIGIILFAKYPAPNMAKTRLQPALGVDGAAHMARQLLLHSIEQAVATDFAVELCVSPAPADPCWQMLDLPKSLQWSAQVEGDLGMRMLIASQSALEKYEKVVLIGTDCPSLTAERIRTALQQLDQHDAVMIPATDGGYVLLGFKQVDASLFFRYYLEYGERRWRDQAAYRRIRLDSGVVIRAAWHWWAWWFSTFTVKLAQYTQQNLKIKYDFLPLFIYVLGRVIILRPLNDLMG